METIQFLVVSPTRGSQVFNEEKIAQHWLTLHGGRMYILVLGPNPRIAVW